MEQFQNSGGGAQTANPQAIGTPNLSPAGGDLQQPVSGGQQQLSEFGGRSISVEQCTVDCRQPASGTEQVNLTYKPIGWWVFGLSLAAIVLVYLIYKMVKETPKVAISAEIESQLPKAIHHPLTTPPPEPKKPKSRKSTKKAKKTVNKSRPRAKRAKK